MATIRYRDIGLGVVLALAVLLQNASSATFKVLHTFKNGKDGSFPFFALTVGGDGNLYGLTVGAPAAPSKHCSKGCGNAYALTRSGRDHVIFYFDGRHGAVPGSPLLLSGGVFYGASDTSRNRGQGGTVYELTPDGKQTILYTFCTQMNCADGSGPWGHLVADSDGNLYGTTLEGGNNNPPCRKSHDKGCGVLYKIAPDGTETVLYLFCSQANCADGYLPADGVAADSAGNFYGTTEFGGAHDKGALFEFSAAGTFSVLYSFCSAKGCADGNRPAAGVVLDGAGNLYGTTLRGGGGPCKTAPAGCGVVYKLDPAGKETVLYAFAGGKADGKYPDTRLILDAQSNLYGTTVSGGSAGGGTAFRLAAGGGETVLHDFCSQTGCADGRLPQELLLDGKDLFGVATIGGLPKCNCGVAYKLNSK